VSAEYSDHSYTVTVRAGTASELTKKVSRSAPFVCQPTNRANEAHSVGRNATEVEPIKNNDVKIHFRPLIPQYP